MQHRQQVLREWNGCMGEGQGWRGDHEGGQVAMESRDGVASWRREPSSSV